MQVRQPRASFAPNASEAAIAEPRKTTRNDLGLIRMFPSLNRIESRLFVSTRSVRCNRHGSGAALYKPWRKWEIGRGQHDRPSATVKFPSLRTGDEFLESACIEHGSAVSYRGRQVWNVRTGAICSLGGASPPT